MRMSPTSLQSVYSSSFLKIIMYTESFKQKNLNNKQIRELKSNRHILPNVKLMKE